MNKSPNWCSNCKKETEWLIVPFQPSIVQCKECGHLKKFPSLKVGRPKLEKPSVQEKKTEKAIEKEIHDYERSIERLTILFSKGEISEESYKKAIRTIEEKLDMLPTKCPECGEEISRDLELCPYCGSYTTYAKKPTGFWYLLPFLSGLLGGILAYIAVKDEDKGMATNLLWFGIVMTFVDIVVTWLLLFGS